MFSYTVSCEFDDPAVAAEWIAWIRDEHLRDVIEAGAVDGEVVMLDPVAVGEPGGRDEASRGRAVCEVHYHFADRAAFERYERDHAPRLRAEGLKRFPPERGVRYTRRTGEVVAGR